MSRTVVAHPKMGTSYYTIAKAGNFWDVVLVTPHPGRSLRTKLRRFADRASAEHDARETARRTRRLLKLGGRPA